jgi:hypothetical protein
MSGADFVFNNVKGEVKTLCGLSAANDALIYVLLEATGLEADATLKDYDDLSALLAGASNEQTNQGRKSVTSATITVDDTNDRVDIDIADQTYAALGGNATGKLLICWDGDTTAGTDANIRPLTAHSFDITPDGTDVSAVIAASGFYRAS